MVLGREACVVIRCYSASIVGDFEASYPIFTKPNFYLTAVARPQLVNIRDQEHIFEIAFGGLNMTQVVKALSTLPE